MLTRSSEQKRKRASNAQPIKSKAKRNKMTPIVKKVKTPSNGALLPLYMITPIRTSIRWLCVQMIDEVLARTTTPSAKEQLNILSDELKTLLQSRRLREHQVSNAFANAEGSWDAFLSDFKPDTDGEEDMLHRLTGFLENAIGRTCYIISDTHERCTWCMANRELPLSQADVEAALFPLSDGD